MLLESGNFVPADVRLIESVNLKIDESSLVGESVAVEKQAAAVLKPDAPVGDRNNTAFMSTLVTHGRGKGVVVHTGMQTQIGLIAEMIQSYEEEPTPRWKSPVRPTVGRPIAWWAIPPKVRCLSHLPKRVCGSKVKVLNAARNLRTPARRIDRRE